MNSQLTKPTPSLESAVADLQKRVAQLEEALAKKAFNTYGIRWNNGEFLTQEQADYLVQNDPNYRDFQEQ